jgi:hypothetical protein
LQGILGKLLSLKVAPPLMDVLIHELDILEAHTNAARPAVPLSLQSVSNVLDQMQANLVQLEANAAAPDKPEKTLQEMGFALTQLRQIELQIQSGDSIANPLAALVAAAEIAQDQLRINQVFSKVSNLTALHVDQANEALDTEITKRVDALKSGRAGKHAFRDYSGYSGCPCPGAGGALWTLDTCYRR